MLVAFDEFYCHIIRRVTRYAYSDTAASHDKDLFHFRVKILETNKEKSHRIAEVVPSNVLIINGDGRDTELLMQEGIKDAQAFVALTDNSSTNILACLAAKRFGVFKTVAKIENIDYIPLAENMDIGSVINKKLIAASHIYQFLLDADVSNVKCLTFANADVAEQPIKENTCRWIWVKSAK